jgi:uncharacterized repeat protein (TIGR01451 family)
MRNRMIVIAILALGIGGLASTALAQDSWQQDPRQPKTFGERLGDLGRSILGQPDDRDLPAPTRSSRNYNSGAATADTAQPRAGSVRPGQSQTPVTAQRGDEPSSSFGFSDNYRTLPPQPSSRPPTASNSVPDYGASQPWDNGPTSGIGGLQDSGAKSFAATKSAAPATAAAPATTAVAPASASPNPGATPLYERMKSLRRSAFDDTPAPAKSGMDTPADPPLGKIVDRPVTSSPPATPPAILRQTPTLAPARPATDVGEGKPASGAAAQRVFPSLAPTVSSKEADPESNKWSGKGKVESKADSEGNVLFARKGPILSVETLGPRRITVGKEAAYEMHLQNTGEVAAEDVVVFISFPEWAEVSGAETSLGGTRTAPQGTTEAFQWVVGRVDAKGREKLTLRIVPRQSRPFDLAVRWDYRPALSQATIEVQEPRLAMRLDGPREVSYGKREVYKLKLANSGNGPAENVIITLLPVTAAESQSVSHKLGTLAAGDERTMEVELTAREAGALSIQVEARADSGAHAELAEKVFVRRAGLQVDMEGPAIQYVGTTATYRIHVRNPGNAPAKNVKIAASLPTGVKFLSGTENVKLATSGNKVHWSLENLDAGAQRELTMKCNLAVSGACRLELASSADDDLASSSETVTRVDAMADLRLEVKDPEGPVPIGEDAVYELRIRNRGTKAAQDVEVVAYFSNGVEPSGAEGHPHRVGPGQVIFSPIPSLAAGSDLALTVRARAAAAGNHIFRAEVHCKPLGSRLVREETTHFYEDASLQASRPPAGGANAVPGRDSSRMADRRSPPVGRAGEPSITPPRNPANDPVPAPLR